MFFADLVGELFLRNNWNLENDLIPLSCLGRRGVFDGTIENMHLHWKYRELVKIIFNDRYFENVESTARTLEAESGGILVAVERVSKGYAVVIYRGKNYRRPANLRPQTLLNKKEALKRSLEAQRYEVHISFLVLLIKVLCLVSYVTFYFSLFL